MQLKSNYDISIIMAVYNMEEYLIDAIESVINQTIGIERIQLILVNDGSSDSSLDICKTYQNMYKQNIFIIDKMNGGVSSARNEGLKTATGDYINFLDADDKLESNACEKVLNFFQKNDVDVVALPLVYFGTREDNHALHWKFTETRVIDIDDEYEAIQMHISSSFIRRQVVQQFSFCEDLKYGEDAELINKCILQKRRYGVLADTVYWYRYRESDTSAMQNAQYSYDNYFPVLRILYWNLIHYEKKLTGKEHISNYLENLILYDLKWKLKRKEVNESIVFGEEGKKVFLEEVSELLSEIHDRSIICLKEYSVLHKMFMFSIKYKKSIDELEEEYKLISNEKKQFIIWRHFILSSVPAIKVFIELFEIKNDKIKLEGKIGGPLRCGEINLSMIVDDGKKQIEYPVIEKDEWRSNTFALNEVIKKRFYFKTTEIQIVDGMQISFILHLGGRDTKMQVGVAKLSKMSNLYRNMYALEKQYLVLRNKYSLEIKKYTSELVIEKEQDFLREIEVDEKLKKEEFQMIKSLRKEYLKKLQKNYGKEERIWIFMDRPNKADDNAEHLFKYAVCQNDGIKKYFVVSKESSDYDRMKQYGTVLDYGSREHQLAMLEAEAIISSHVNNHTYSPFSEDLTEYFRGFLTAKRVFLQHGITKDDVSGWLHKLNKNLSIFVTASPYEYNSIINGRYGYDNGEVVLTGFPRYDNLKDFSEKYILYMPTWDSSVLKMKNDFPIYNPNFNKSKLFKEIDSFLNNERLNTVLKKKGYKILFKPHPNMMIQIDDFKFGENVVLADEKLSYQELFGLGAALVTDYSSTFFDFAYLKKPVIYYQARSNHYIDGYFDYESMGMGKVVRNEQDLEECLEKYIQNDFKIEEKYFERTRKFFKYLDHDNCKRVYEVMLEKFK